MSRIFFLMGVSGSGKTTVLETSGILTMPNFRYVQSYTTRPLREGEINGEKYHHISREDFEQSVEKELFLEWAVVHQDYLYGTKYEDIVGPLAEGISTIKEIDIYGLIALQDNDKIPGMYTSIFLDIPQETITKRIEQRGSISPDELSKRLASAAFERSQAKERCDYIVDASKPLNEVVASFKEILEKASFTT